MNFVLIGVNHQTAPVEVREQFAISEARLPEAVKSLATYPGVEEAMIVSTCNRVELLARTVNGTPICRGSCDSFTASILSHIASICTNITSAMRCGMCSALLPAWTR